ncbi:MAG: hypothetical protein IKZ87_07185 [Actinomycetaceae bacterium]|nr:hypothetical protein [Actinomycetaceae bacterium]
MANMTSQELLALFSQGASINNSDQFLIHSAGGVGGNNAVKVTAETVRAYLLQRMAVTIGEDGYFYIGGVKTAYKAEGVTPILVRREDGIYCSIDNGETYTCIAYFSDFGFQNVVQQTLTSVRISPNVLNVWANAVASLAVEFVAGGQSSINEYMMQFAVSGSNFTLSLPNGVRWVEEPEWEDGYTYQVSVLNNLAVYAGWANPAAQ